VCVVGTGALTSGVTSTGRRLHLKRRRAILWAPNLGAITSLFGRVPVHTRPFSFERSLDAGTYRTNVGESFFALARMRRGRR